MDGFDTNDQVIVIAATNRVGRAGPGADPARAGSTGRSTCRCPTCKGRLEILKVHASKVKLGPDVDLQRLARGTPDVQRRRPGRHHQRGRHRRHAGRTRTPSSRTTWRRPATRSAGAGPRKSRVIDEKEKIATAYHEAGHALVQCLLPGRRPAAQGEHHPARPGPGRRPSRCRRRTATSTPAGSCMAQLRVSFGGRIAEEMFCGDISSGAAMDIRQATDIARTMVTEWGMSEKLGFVLYGGREPATPGSSPRSLHRRDRQAHRRGSQGRHRPAPTSETRRAPGRATATSSSAWPRPCCGTRRSTREEVDRLMKGENADQAHRGRPAQEGIGKGQIRQARRAPRYHRRRPAAGRDPASRLTLSPRRPRRDGRGWIGSADPGEG